MMCFEFKTNWKPRPYRKRLKDWRAGGNVRPLLIYNTLDMQLGCYIQR